MKITYYGTAAGEGWPGVFCQCDLCQSVRRMGGKNIRTRSQALINEDLLLDLPPDNQFHSLCYGLDLGKVRALLITHSHSDHFYPEDLEFLREPYSHTYRGRMQIYGNDAVGRGIVRACGGTGGERERMQFHEVEINQTFTVLDYAVTPLRATHAQGERCLFYHIAQGSKSLLYAHDTGAFTQENLDCLTRQPGKLGLVSLDCTSQMHRDGQYHMGLADADTIWVVNHFSHNGGWLHEEITEQVGKYDMIASYDGMSIEF